MRPQVHDRDIIGHGARLVLPLAGQPGATLDVVIKCPSQVCDGVKIADLVGADIAAGRLVVLLPDYTPIETDLSVVYPPGRQLSAKVRSFVDFLAARFAGEPEWDHWRDQTRSREARRIDK